MGYLKRILPGYKMISSKSFTVHFWTILFIIQLSIIVTTSCEESVRKDIPKTFDYAAYVQRYGKSYKDIEILSRARLFYARTLGIFKKNALYVSHKATHFLKQNECTDMTPTEIQKSLISKDSDLTPVVNATLSPDMPADQFVLSGDDDDDKEDESFQDNSGQASSSERPLKRPYVDFLSNQQDDQLQPRDLLRDLVQHSDVARKASEVIDAVGMRKAEQKVDHYKRVPYKPFVEATNKDYDPSLVPSLGCTKDVNRSDTKIATFMMEDFLGNLEPYPLPEITTRKVLNEGDSPRKPSVFSDFASPFRMLYDYFSNGDGDDDEDNVEELEKAQTDGTEIKFVNKEEKSANGEIIFDIDWRRTGCIPRVKSQLKCNACYAFTVIDLMEFFYCNKKRTSTEFSVQYIIDCGSKNNLNGCRGGKVSNVATFIQKYGIQLNAVYPYNANENQCPYEDEELETKSWALKPTSYGWHRFQEIQAWYKWLPSSPIIVGINMPSDFLAYAGGIHDGSDCEPGMVHAMLLVGSGKQDGKPFWLMKNTFSEAWGEQGYFKLSKKAPIKCFNSAIVVRANFSK